MEPQGLKAGQRHHRRLITAVSCVFMVCLVVGVTLARHKPLWNDELYTQIYSIESLSYSDILRGKINEGNACPLFYVAQKTVCDLFRYHFKFDRKGEWYVHDPTGELILRLAPNVYVSLMIALIFYFFARFYSWRMGIYAMAVTLSSFAVWAYWAEARPYGLWMLLTVIQSLLYIYAVNQERLSGKFWFWLCVVHLLLAMTVALSLVQILVVSFLLWAIKECPLLQKKQLMSFGLKEFIRRYFFLVILPVAVAGAYFLLAPKYKFWFMGNPMALIYANMPPAKIALFLIYAFVFVVCLFFRKGNNPLTTCLRNIRGWHYFFLLSLMFIAALAVLGLLIWKDEGGPEGFVLTSRYFVFLSPLEILATIIFSSDLVNMFQNNRWARLNVYLGLGGLLIIRLLDASLRVYESALYFRY